MLYYELLQRYSWGRSRRSFTVTKMSGSWEDRKVEILSGEKKVNK